MSITLEIFSYVMHQMKRNIHCKVPKMKWLSSKEKNKNKMVELSLASNDISWWMEQMGRFAIVSLFCSFSFLIHYKRKLDYYIFTPNPHSLITHRSSHSKDGHFWYKISIFLLLLLLNCKTKVAICRKP